MCLEKAEKPQKSTSWIHLLLLFENPLPFFSLFLSSSTSFDYDSFWKVTLCCSLRGTKKRYVLQARCSAHQGRKDTLCWPQSFPNNGGWFHLLLHSRGDGFSISFFFFLPFLMIWQLGSKPCGGLKGTNRRNIKNSDLYVVKVGILQNSQRRLNLSECQLNGNGGLANSLPCHQCVQWLVRFNVKRVFYSVSGGAPWSYRAITVRDLWTATREPSEFVLISQSLLTSPPPHSSSKSTTHLHNSWWENTAKNNRCPFEGFALIFHCFPNEIIPFVTFRIIL